MLPMGNTKEDVVLKFKKDCDCQNLKTRGSFSRVYVVMACSNFTRLPSSLEQGVCSRKKTMHLNILFSQ